MECEQRKRFKIPMLLTLFLFVGSSFLTLILLAPAPPVEAVETGGCRTSGARLVQTLNQNYKICTHEVTLVSGATRFA